MKADRRVEAIQSARRLLRLPSSASLQRIREAYREIARELHPDAHPGEDPALWEARMQELNAAYALLIDYCSHYSFSFKPESIERQCRTRDPAEYWRKQFIDE